MTITLTREEAQQVLDALDEYRDSTEDFRVANRCISLIETLRARLSAPEPTLVLWNVKSNRLASPSDDRAQVFAIRKLEWRGLTDEEVSEIERTSMTRAQAICAIEAKLKEKNT